MLVAESEQDFGREDFLKLEIADIHVATAEFTRRRCWKSGEDTF